MNKKLEVEPSVNGNVGEVEVESSSEAEPKLPLVDSKEGVVVEKVVVSGEGQGDRSDDEAMKEDEIPVVPQGPVKGDYPMEEASEIEGKLRPVMCSLCASAV